MTTNGSPSATTAALAETSEPAPPTSTEPVAAPGARHALTLLVLINLFNYIDRQVLAAVEPKIRDHFFPLVDGKEPANALTWMGVLPFAFLLTYMLASPIFGWLSNRMSRWLLIGIGVGLWSLASGASGLAGTFVILLLTRCLVGIGEAVYGPVAPDVISDLYPLKKRGQVLAWFYAAIPFGGALGYAFGAFFLDWRQAFYYVVPPGLLLGVWCLFMREPKRGAHDGEASERRSENWRDYFILLKTPSWVLNTLGMTAMCFAMGGLAFWAPGYLKERGVDNFLGIESIPATMAFGAITALTGLLATLVGGWAGDALRGRFPGSYFLVSGAAMIVAFPMLLVMTFMPFPWAWIPLSVFVFCLFFNTGPTNTILANVTHPLLRAPGFAFNILIIHLFGDAVSPFVMGFIADRKEWGWNLGTAFQVVSVTVFLGGLLWLWGTRYLDRDTELAPTRLAKE
jgi:MFS transporter, Spinster family, sphingosine-1-phosphate transporter